MNKKTGASVRVSDNITSSISLSTPRIPELEGKVKVELFDAKTGELRQSVEGKNLVTNIIRDIFASNYLGSLNYNQMLPLVDFFFGGILCFQNTLTENADNYYPPTTSTNPVIAHAGQQTYTSAEDDLTRGLPSPESEPVTNGYKRVWEFGSSQGNGTISALALTNKDTGDFWINNGASYQPLLDLQNASTPLNRHNVLKPLYFYDITRNIFYRINADSNNIYIQKISNSSPLDSLTLTQTGTMAAPSDSSLIENWTFSWNDLGGGGQQHLIFFPSKGTNGQIHSIKGSGTTLVKRIIDCTDGTITNADVTMASGISLSSNGTNYPQRIQNIGLDKNGYFYLPSNVNTKIYKINYEDPTDITEVTTTIATSFGYTGYGCGNYYLTNTGFITDGSVIKTCATFGATTGYGDVYQINQIGTAPVYLTPATNEYNMLDGKLAVCKMFLSTVKNLPSPVTKDSTMTMKITYTITEVEEES